VHFGFGLPSETNRHLQTAAAVVDSSEEALQALHAAQESAPDQLPVLIALYKFHFYRGETEKAHELVLQTLSESSRQGGFSQDWASLSPHSADWSDPRGPGRVFLYSLKALAFIHLRRNEPGDAAGILEVLERLDPTDQVGAEVIRNLLQGLTEESDDG
jgi:hypothetical protein